MKELTKWRVGMSSSAQSTEPAVSGRTRQTHPTLKGWLSPKLLLPTPLLSLSRGGVLQPLGEASVSAKLGCGGLGHCSSLPT